MRKSIKFTPAIVPFLACVAFIGNSFSQGGFAALTNGGMNDFSNPYQDEKYGLDIGMSVFGDNIEKPNVYAEIGAVFDAGFTRIGNPIFGGGGLASLGVSYNQDNLGKSPPVLYCLSLNEYLLVQKWSNNKESEPDSYVLDYIAVSSISLDVSFEVRSEVFIGFKASRSLFDGVIRRNKTSGLIPSPNQVEPWRIGIKIQSPFLFSGV